VSATAPLLTAGTIQQQFGAPFSAFAGSTFTATSVAALTGRAAVGSAFLPDVAIVSLTGTGSSSFSLSATENRAGVVTVGSGQAHFVNADQFGRVGTDLTSPFAFVFYMISQDTAFCIGEATSTGQPNPFFGVFQPQSGSPFTAASIAGSFIEGTAAPAAPGANLIAGTVQLTQTNATSGTVSGIQDQSTPAANAAAQATAGTYAITNSAIGFGTASITQPAAAALTGDFAIISPTRLLMITTTTGETNPSVIIFEK
jgi:hypothetical protein